MRPSFSSSLINEPFGDPGLYVDIAWGQRALLFDLGDTSRLSPTALLRVSDAFISHTHMDHFIGFDRLLRIALGRGRTLRLFGPPGLLDNIAGKLSGYTWNLVDGYPLCIQVHEFSAGRVSAAQFRATTGFRTEPLAARATSPSSQAPFVVLEDPMFTVRAVALDHRIPSFAYALEEQFHININKERLHGAGLPVGSWLKAVKQYLWEGKPEDFEFTATLYREHRREERRFRLGEFRDRFVTITRGQKIAYVVDARFDQRTEALVTQLAHHADVLYCEAPFLDRDGAKAAERYHLTARQAGRLARQADVRKLVVFHFSPRYTGQGDQLELEAQSAFRSD